MPSFGDTLTKVWGTHTLKAGFLYEWIRNVRIPDDVNIRSDDVNNDSGRM